MKICFTSSAGGHFNQLNILIKEYKEYDHFVITEKTNFAKSILEENNSYLFNIINRSEKLFVFKFIKNSIKLMNIMYKEKPDLIISTGALITVPVCYIGKLLGAKVIFIESFAKVEEPTLSGRLVSRICDKVLVQWPDMTKHYDDEKVDYGGTIY